MTYTRTITLFLIYVLSVPISLSEYFSLIKVLIFKGSFIVADTQLCNQSLAIWTSNGWNSFTLENFTNDNQQYSLSCGNISSDLIIAYFVPHGHVWTPTLALVNHQNFSVQYFVSPTPVEFKQIVMWVVENNVFIRSFGNSLVMFNLTSHNWTSITLPVKCIIKKTTVTKVNRLSSDQ